MATSPGAGALRLGGVSLWETHARGLDGLREAA
jgi:hypothetical protein